MRLIKFINTYIEVDEYVKVFKKEEILYEGLAGDIKIRTGNPELETVNVCPNTNILRLYTK